MREIIDSFMYYTGAFISMAVLAIFLENTVFTRALGTSTSLLIVRKKINLLLFGAVLTFITICSSVVVYLVNPIIAKADNKYYITPLIYITIIGVVYILALVVIGRLPKKVKSKMVPMIHLSAFNCAVLGSLLLTNMMDLNLLSAIGFGFGTGVGFVLATFLVSVSYEHLSSDKIPAPFRGFPIIAIYLGIISMAFYGMIGHQLPF